jgi:hypothetical protein
MFIAAFNKRPPLGRILSQINPVHTTPFISLKINLPKQPVLIRGSLWHFVTSLFIYGDELAPQPTSQLGGGASLVGCPRLLIEYTSSYPPYLEAATSVRNLTTRHAVVTSDLPNV